MTPGPRVRCGALVAVLWAACTGTPATLADCAGLGDVAAQEECRYDMVAPLIDDEPALEAALADLDATASPQSRDLLLLRLAIAAPTRAGALCARVTTDGATEKCRQVLGRPHLQQAPRAPRPEPGGGGGGP